QALPAETATSDLDFDDDFKINTKRLPQCDPGQLSGTTPDQAIAMCGKGSQVGTGTAKAACGNPGDPSNPIPINDVVVTAVNGHPSIILHSYTATAGTTTVLVGEYIKSPHGGDYGTRLHVPVDPLLGGACTLTDFSTTTGGVFKPQGKKKKKVFYTAGRCHD